MSVNYQTASDSIRAGLLYCVNRIRHKSKQFFYHSLYLSLKSSLMIVRFLFFISLLFILGCQQVDPKVVLTNLLKDIHQDELENQVSIIAYDSTYQKNKLNFYKNSIQTLNDIDTAALTKPLQFEYQKAKDELSAYVKNIEFRQVFKKNAAIYFVGSKLLNAFNHSDLVVSDSLSTPYYLLKNVGPFFETAKANLKDPNPQSLTDGIQKMEEDYFTISKKLKSRIEQDSLTLAHQELYLKEIENSRLAVKDFLAYLKSLEFEYFDQQRSN